MGSVNYAELAKENIEKFSGVLCMANHISSDIPQVTKDNDKLDYVPFAEALAKGLVASNPINGLVVALYGKWGIGKTTILNFIKEEINKMLVGEDKAETIKVVDFNPWWFSGREQLARDLIDVIEENIVGTKRIEKIVKEKLLRYSDTISRTANCFAQLLPMGNVAKDMIGIVKSFMKTTTAPSELTTLKADICDALCEYDKKMIVVIDDIDRLRPKEIVELFTVVKALADFPNVIYVMAFDREIVERAIENVLFNGEKMTGHQYLDKIVQVEFTMPIIEYSRMKSMLRNAIYSIIPKKNILDMQHWNEVFDSISCIYKTPREIYRLKNTLSVTYPSVENIVCPADFVAIESIRLILPSVYKQIGKNLHRLVGEWIDITPSGQDERNKSDFMDDIYKHCTDEEQHKISKDTLETILQELFPVLDAYSYMREDEIIRENEGRICSCNACLSYFRFLQQDGAICTADVVEDLQDIENGNRVETFDMYIFQALQEFNLQHLSIICKTIEANIDVLSEEEYGKAFHHLFDSGDYLLWKIFEKQSDTRSDVYAANYSGIILDTLSAVVVQKHIDVIGIFNDTIKYSKNISYATAMILGKHLIGYHYDDLFKIAKTELLSALNINQKINMPFVSLILCYLCEESDAENILPKYTRAHMQEDDEAIKFLSQFMQCANSQTDTTRLTWTNGAEVINKIFDNKFCLKRLEKIQANDGLSDKDRAVVSEAVKFFNPVVKSSAQGREKRASSEELK